MVASQPSFKTPHFPTTSEGVARTRRRHRRCGEREKTREEKREDSLAREELEVRQADYPIGAESLPATGGEEEGEA